MPHYRVSFSARPDAPPPRAGGSMVVDAYDVSAAIDVALRELPVDPRQITGVVLAEPSEFERRLAAEPPPQLGTPEQRASLTRRIAAGGEGGPMEPPDEPTADHRGQVLEHDGAGFNAVCACGFGRWADSRAVAEAVLVEHVARNALEAGV